MRNIEGTFDEVLERARNMAAFCTDRLGDLDDDVAILVLDLEDQLNKVVVMLDELIQRRAANRKQSY